MMMMMIMIAGFIDSVTTPVKTWLDMVLTSPDHHKTTSMVLEEVGAGSSRVDCIVCLSEVALGERLAMLERCRHGFHVECVEAWLKDHPNCPLCRTPISGANEDTHKHKVYLKKLYEMMNYYGFRALETMASWLTNSFSKGLHSSLSQSCSYL